jgi:hypothetical protein
MYTPPQNPHTLNSGVWLQFQGLTAGMHSHTSEAAISAKILRDPGDRWHGFGAPLLSRQSQKQVYSTVFDPQQLERDAAEPHIWPNVYLVVALLREPIRIARAQP